MRAPSGTRSLVDALEGVGAAVDSISIEGLSVTLGRDSAQAWSRATQIAIKRNTPVILIAPRAGPIEAREAALWADDLSGSGIPACGVVPTFVVTRGELQWTTERIQRLADFWVHLSDEAEASPSLATSLATTVATRIGAWLVRLPLFRLDQRILPSKVEDSVGRPEDVVPASLRGRYSAADLLQSFVDGGRLAAQGEGYAPEVLTALAAIDGHSVGIMGNSVEANGGRLTTAGCRKIVHLVRTCIRFHLPLVSIVDSRGIAVPSTDRALVGDYVATARYLRSSQIAKCAIVVGYASGLAATLMGAVGARADYVAAWPRARFSTNDTDDGQPNAFDVTANAAVLDLIAPGDTRRVLADVVDLLRGDRTYNAHATRASRWEGLLLS